MCALVPFAACLTRHLPRNCHCRTPQFVKRQKSQPKLNPDGTVRLNARQRRTLRRAQERAMKALVEMQQAAHGGDPEQAAAQLAASMPLLAVGPSSPGPAEPAYQAVVSSPVQQLYPIPPSYAAAGMVSPVGMLPVMLASPFSAQPMAAGEFEGGMAVGAVSTIMAMPITHQPMHAPHPMVFGGRTPGGHHQGPRLSRFAPAAVC